MDIITTAAIYWAKLELGKVVGTAAAKQLGTAAAKQVYERLTTAAAAGSPYRNELYRVVDRLLEEYRQQYPDALTGNKHYFWATTWALDWALTYRFYSPNVPLQLADMPEEWGEYIHLPTQTELDAFSERVHVLLSSNEKLRQLYASENHLTETFRANARREEQQAEANNHLISLAKAAWKIADSADTATRQAEQAARVRSVFEGISWSLASADNTIPNLDVRLLRQETSRVLSWLTSPLQLNEQPLAVVEGGAGMGKTAIMRDVLEGVRGQNLPVLALKADRQYNATYEGLVKLLLTGTGLTEISQALDLLRADYSHNTVVVLIDQLDALSQSLSTNRELLRSYRELIHALLAAGDVRVVLSCRTFDLETDPLLQTYSKKSRFPVDILSNEQVEQVVSVSTLAGQPLGPALRELLRVPLHLRIFCELRGGTNTSGIKTLQALYDELYRQRVLDPVAPDDAPAPNSEKLQTLLSELAVAMHQSQRLTVPGRRYERLYANEVRYALSQNLLVHAREGNQLQCFHQTFSDYLFARQFVETGQQLPALLGEKHQGLFVRSAVSQVLQYLREYDERQYLQHVRELLLRPESYRLHIRLLVVQRLAQLPNPTRAEQQIARQHLLASSGYREPFLEGVRDYGWSQWLVDQQIVQQLLAQPQEWSSSERAVLWNMAKHQAVCMYEALNRVEVNELTSKRAVWMLWLSSENEAPGFEPTFARFAAVIAQHEAWEYVSILENRARWEPEATAERLFTVLKDESHYDYRKNNNSTRDHRVKDAIEALLKVAPDTGFGLLRLLLEHWVDRQSEERLREAGFEVDIRSIIGDTEFGLHTPKGRHAIGLTAELYDLTQEHLEETARQEPARARALLSDWPASKMRSLLQLTCATYLSHPDAFTEDIFQLLLRPALLRDVNHGGHLNYYLRELIAQSYGKLAAWQQKQLRECILDTHSVLDWDEQREPVARTATWVCQRLYTRHGRLAYGYLSAIPNVEGSNEKVVKRRYQELRRRFNVIENKAPRGMTMRSGEPSLLSKEILEMLSPQEWLAAFRKHQGRTTVFPFNDYGPRLARAFGEEVQTRPDQLTKVINLLLALENQDVPTRPLFEGLAGLAKSEAFNQVQYTDFVQRGINNGQISLSDTEGLRLLEGCVVDGQADDWVVERFAQIAVMHRHDTRGTDSDELSDGINTVGGHAIDGLLRCYKMVQYTDLMHDTVRQLAADGSLAVRAATIYRSRLLAPLYHPVTQPVLDLLVALVGTNYQLLRFGEGVLHQLLNAHLADLRHLFESALIEPLSHELVAHTLTLAWAWNIDTAYEQLQPYWQQSAKARTKSLRLLMHEYQKLLPAQKVKAQHVFQQFLAYDGEDLRQAYECCFLWLEASDVTTWLPLVQAYVAAPVGQGRERYFYDFLQLGVQDYPHDCIELVTEFQSHAVPDTQQNALEKKPLELLLSAYHVLVEIDQDAPELDVAMNTFDKMLQIPAYRQAATAALASVDRY